MTYSHRNMRVENNCLFLDDSDSGSVVLQHNARPGMRPYIHPLRAPNGKTCLTEDSPWHHPWQHGITTGFHGVNGCDFWYDPGQRAGVPIGRIEPGTPMIIGDNAPSWSIEALWRHADSTLLLVETQTWSLERADNLLRLDLDWRMQAIPHVRFEQQPYGGLFLRMPHRKEQGGSVLNSNGMRGSDCEQQAAAWVDVSMPIEGSKEVGGITIYDHPDNTGHPARWRVDNQLGINPAPCIPGPIELAPGESMDYRYRLILRTGLLNMDQIQEQFEDPAWLSSSS